MWIRISYNMGRTSFDHLSWLMASRVRVVTFIMLAAFTVGESVATAQETTGVNTGFENILKPQRNVGTAQALWEQFGNFWTVQDTSPNEKRQTSKTPITARPDFYGDPLPPYVLMRYGTIRLRHEEAVTVVAFSPDGTTLASCSLDGRVRLWDATTGKKLHSLKGHQGKVTTLAFFPAGKVLATGTDKGQITFWDPIKGTILRQFQAHDQGINRLVVSSRDVVIAAGVGVSLWNRQAKRLGIYAANERRLVNGVAVSPDGRLLATGSTNGIIRLWDIEKKKSLASLMCRDNKDIQHLAFSNDGKYLATGGNSALVLWHVGKRKKICAWQGSVRTPIVFLRKDKLLAAGMYAKASDKLPDGFKSTRLVIWDCVRKKAVLKFPEFGSGHKVLDVSPDGKRLASSGDVIPTRIRLWDAVTGKELLIPPKGCHRRGIKETRDKRRFLPFGEA